MRDHGNIGGSGGSGRLHHQSFAEFLNINIYIYTPVGKVKMLGLAHLFKISYKNASYKSYARLDMPEHSCCLLAQGLSPEV